MTKVIFLDLLNELRDLYLLHGSSRTTAREVLAITLYILSQNESIRGAMERFQHFSETISRYFSVGLNALVSLAYKIIKPDDPTFQTILTQIANDPRYMTFFKDCIGAIDGTHVDAHLPLAEKVAYIGRCGSPTQIIMAVCSAYDSHVFKFATRNLEYGFPYPPPGKYYLVDTGYPLQRGFLKPYLDTKYHIPDFERSSGVACGKKELFNKIHSSLRGVIEGSFGVWKKKWVILRDMSTYPFPKQVQIVVATMALHNFIRRHPSRTDAEFAVVNADLIQIPSEAFEYHVGHTIPQLTIDSPEKNTRDGEGASEMAALRDGIADEISENFN
ncbi:uncharacterized protein LOC110036532 [Phalaenopsis equestris]|uniref:uncharacterized protein LOC110036532 n=1 Tax=Phalaenopsis equestris TaxID=78828 RepID=UPI0009E206D9|nr:uncharacterized protein LOC110036532 [Phalaenopsis equestris]